MQPYRQTKPHPAAECRVCAAGGHQMCQHGTCGELAEVQYQRHATDAEYAAIPEHLVPRDGLALMTVFVCGDDEPDPICRTEDHLPLSAVAAPGPCAKCGASDDASCVTAGGRPRRIDHPGRVRTAAPPDGGVCRHAHRPDCEGVGACACTAADTAPARPAHPLPFAAS